MRSIAGVIFFIYLFSALPAAAEVEPSLEQTASQIVDHCEAFVAAAEPMSLPQGLITDTLAAGKSLQEYFQEIGHRLFEREYISQGMQRALVARQPLVVVGPPGNGKTAFVSMALGNILDENGRPSFFTDQMTFETTLADTHGPIDFKQLMESGRQERFLDEGIYGHLFSLLDEQFDLRPNAYRNILTALQNGRYRGQIGRAWMIAGASNKSIPEVYARFPLHDDSARALLDRYAGVFYVPAEFTQTSSYLRLARIGQSQASPLPEVTINDLKHLNGLLPRVIVPDHVAQLLALIQYQMKPILEARENTALRNFLEAKLKGESPSVPPWKSTKYMNPRTYEKALTILRATVVLDWATSGAARPLVASINDLETLVDFYSIIGPSDEELDFHLTRTGRDSDKDQIATIRFERELFLGIFNEIKKKFNDTAGNMTPVQELYDRAQRFKKLKRDEKSKLLNELRDLFKSAYAARSLLEQSRMDSLTPEIVAHASLLEVVYDVLVVLFPDRMERERVVSEWIRFNESVQNDHQTNSSPATPDQPIQKPGTLHVKSSYRQFPSVDERWRWIPNADGVGHSLIAEEVVYSTRHFQPLEIDRDRPGDVDTRLALSPDVTIELTASLNGTGIELTRIGRLENSPRPDVSSLGEVLRFDSFNIPFVSMSSGRIFMASKQLVHGFPLPGRGSGVDSRIVTSNHSGPWDETAPWSAPVLWSSSDTTFHHFGGHNQIYTLDLEKNEIITNDLDPSVDWADSRFLGTHQDKIILQIATSKANLPHEEVQFSIAILQLSPNGLNSNYQHPIFSHAERPPILKISRYQDGIVQNQPRLWVWDDQGLSLSAAFPDLNSFQRILDKSQLAALLRDQYPGADYEVEDILEESVNEVLLFLRATDENAPFRALLVSVPVPGSTAGSER